MVIMDAEIPYGIIILNTFIFSWRKDERYLPIRNSQSIYSNGTLHIEKVDVDDVGNYTCIAKSGSQSLSSNSAVLDLACKYHSSSH